MLQWFMKKRNHSRAIFVTYVESIHVGKKPFKCNTWNNMLKKRIKTMYLFIWKHTYRIVASRSTSRLVTCLGLYRLLMKGIFDPYVLWPFGKKLIFWLLTRVSTHDFTVSIKSCAIFELHEFFSFSKKTCISRPYCIQKIRSWFIKVTNCLVSR